MRWIRVTVPKIWQQSTGKLAILFVHSGNLGEFSLVSIPADAFQVTPSGGHLMRQSFVARIAITSKRLQGVQVQLTPALKEYVYGPIEGKYYDIMGREVRVKRAAA